jgi:hypothetical protein
MSITIREIQRLLMERGYRARRCSASEPDLYELSIRHSTHRTAKVRVTVRRNDVCHVALYAWADDGTCRQSSPLPLKVGDPDFVARLLTEVKSLVSQPVILHSLAALPPYMEIR